MEEILGSPPELLVHRQLSVRRFRVHFNKRVWETALSPQRFA
jgi:hypothetical protein